MYITKVYRHTKVNWALAVSFISLSLLSVKQLTDCILANKSRASLSFIQDGMFVWVIRALWIWALMCCHHTDVGTHTHTKASRIIWSTITTSWVKSFWIKSTTELLASTVSFYFRANGKEEQHSFKMQLQGCSGSMPYSGKEDKLKNAVTDALLFSLR